MSITFYPCIQTKYAQVLVLGTQHGNYEEYLHEHICNITEQISSTKPIFLWEYPNMNLIPFEINSEMPTHYCAGSGWENPLIRLGAELVYFKAFTISPDLLDIISTKRGRDFGHNYAKELSIWLGFYSFIYLPWVINLITNIIKIDYSAPPEWFLYYRYEFNNIVDSIILPEFETYDNIFSKVDWTIEHHDILINSIYEPISKIILPNLYRILIPYIYDSRTLSLINKYMLQLQNSQSKAQSLNSFRKLAKITRDCRDIAILQLVKTYSENDKIIIIAGNGHLENIYHILTKSGINVSTSGIISNNYEGNIIKILDMFLNQNRCFEYTF